MTAVAELPRKGAERLAPRAAATRRSAATAATGERATMAVELAAIHALGWLVAGCAVGVLMASLLLFPELGVLLGPLTYGRWAPLHLDLVLYGWCGLALVAILLRAYAPAGDAGPLPAAAVHVWSGSLLAGSASWLAGRSSGRLFLDWTGPARAVFLAALAVLALALADGLRRRMREAAPRGRGARELAVLWAALLAVPVALLVATRPDVYPPINPASGGPTGTSLLGSTLAVVAIILATPRLLGLERRGGRAAGFAIATGLALHGGFFLALGSGDRSGRDPLQFVALASLLPWAVAVPAYLHRFTWPSATRRWRAAFLAWGGALLVTAVPLFLPVLLDRVKFTNALVAHAHLAMAGLASSFAALALVALDRRGAVAAALDDRPAFVLWQGGTVAHVVALAAVGALEAGDPGTVFRGDPGVIALYAARWAAGVLMLSAAARWLGGALRRIP